MSNSKFQLRLSSRGCFVVAGQSNSGGRLNSFQYCWFILWLSVIDPMTIAPAFSTTIVAYFTILNWSTAAVLWTEVTDTISLGPRCKDFTITQNMEEVLDSGSLVAIPLNAHPENATVGRILTSSTRRSTIFCWGLLTFWNVFCKTSLRFTEEIIAWTFRLFGRTK